MTKGRRGKTWEDADFLAFFATFTLVHSRSLALTFSEKKMDRSRSGVLSSDAWRSDSVTSLALSCCLRCPPLLLLASQTYPFSTVLSLPRCAHLNFKVKKGSLLRFYGARHWHELPSASSHHQREELLFQAFQTLPSAENPQTTLSLSTSSNDKHILPDAMTHSSFLTQLHKLLWSTLTFMGNRRLVNILQRLFLTY